MYNLAAVLRRSPTLVIAVLTALVAAPLAACAGDAAPVDAPDRPQQQPHTKAQSTSPEGQVSPTAPTLRRHTVDADGHPIAVHSKRPARASAAVVLIHGRTWSGLPDFDLQVPGADVSLMDGLAAAGVAAYAVDLRGYGATPRDATGFLTPTRAVADVTAVLRFVARDAAEAGASGRPILLGWSMGALVSALTVQTDPSLVGGLVLYGYPCRATPVPAAKDPVSPKRAANTAEAAASDFITPGSVSRAVVDGFVAAALQADPVRADWRGGAEWDAIRFAELRVPVLVIHGERDPVTDRGCMAARFAELHDVDRRWQILAGSDHAAHLETSAGRFLNAVLEFVGRRER
jgi:pimeloyl-ACP methyl ester carboxylesterase